MDVHFAAHVLPVLTGMITPDRQICYSILSSHATAPDCKLYAVCYIIDACCVYMAECFGQSPDLIVLFSQLKIIL